MRTMYISDSNNWPLKDATDEDATDLRNVIVNYTRESSVE